MTNGYESGRASVAVRSGVMLKWNLLIIAALTGITGRLLWLAGILVQASG